MEQFVFFWVKDSVAAVKMESSVLGRVGLGSVAFSEGEEGGVGYAVWLEDWACQTERKLSRPRTLGRSHWYVMGFSDFGGDERTCWRISDEFAICGVC